MYDVSASQVMQLQKLTSRQNTHTSFMSPSLAWQMFFFEFVAEKDTTQDNYPHSKLPNGRINTTLVTGWEHVMGLHFTIDNILPYYKTYCETYCI